MEQRGKKSGGRHNTTRREPGEQFSESLLKKRGRPKVDFDKVIKRMRREQVPDDESIEMKE